MNTRYFLALTRIKKGLKLGAFGELVGVGRQYTLFERRDPKFSRKALFDIMAYAMFVYNNNGNEFPEVTREEHVAVLCALNNIKASDIEDKTSFLRKASQNIIKAQHLFKEGEVEEILAFIDSV